MTAKQGKLQYHLRRRKWKRKKPSAKWIIWRIWLVLLKKA